MDLVAYAMIDTLDALAKANGIEVPSLRGYRLMSKEEPWDDAYLAEVENNLVGIYWCLASHRSDLGLDRSQEDFIAGYRPADIPRSRVRKEFRDCLGCTITVFDEVSMVRARWHRQAMLWNRYAGKEGVLHIHSRMGGTGRARGDYHKDGEVFWHEGWDVRDQPWFLDVCADAFDDTYCDIYARIDVEEVARWLSYHAPSAAHRTSGLRSTGYLTVRWSATRTDATRSSASAPHHTAERTPTESWPCSKWHGTRGWGECNEK